MNCVIESAKRNEHAQIIAEFQVEMAKETENMDLNFEKTKKGVQHIFDNPKEGQYWVSLYEGQAVGCLLTLYEWSDWRQGTVLWVHSVFVKKEFRGQGVFKKLYSMLQEKVRQNPSYLGIRLYVDKRNLKAQKVYKSLGMTDEHYSLFEWMAP